MRWSVLLALAALAAMPAAGAAPEQVHVAFDGTGLSVAWARQGDVSADVVDVVQWDTGDGLLGQTVPARAPLVVPPGTTLLSATLPVAQGTVRYRVGSDADGWSEVRTVRLPSAEAGAPMRIAVYGDHGVGAESSASARLVPMVLNQSPQLVLHAGDLSYADGRPAVWDTWFRLVEPLAATVPYMAAAGNHEHEGYYAASGPEPSAAPTPGAVLDPYHQFRSRFALPGDELWYSFDAGPVHVLVINTEDLCATQPVTYYVPWRVSPACDPGTSDTAVAEGRPNEELLAFVRADLEANRGRPWTFVLMHRPVHSAGSYVGDPILQRHFAPVFEELGVDLVLSGHDHTYQRSFPLRGMEPVGADPAAAPKDAAPVYIVSGGGGEGLYSLQEQQPAWTAARAGAYHHLLLDVTADGLRGQVIDTEDGHVIDAFTIGSWPADDAAAPAQDAPMLAAPATLAMLAVALMLARRR